VALITPVQRAFNGGLWSPRLFGRNDLDAYQTAMSKCENLIPTVAGHLRRRQGTVYAGDSKRTTDTVRLIPFVFSATDSMVLELGDLYCRFWKNGAPVLSGGFPHEVALPYTGTEVLELDWTQDADTFVLVHRNHPPRLLQRFADDDWRTTVLEILYGPYLGRGETLPGLIPTAATLNVVTPLWLTTTNAAPATRDLRIAPPLNQNFIARDGPTSGDTAIGTAFNFERDIGRLILINGFNPNIAGAVGDHASTNDFIDAELAWPLYGVITDVTDAAGASVITGDGAGIDVEFYDGYYKANGPTAPGNVTISTQNWFMQAIFEASDGSIREWPGTVTFFEDRLFMASTSLGPDIVYGSRIGTLDDFDILSASDWPPVETKTVGTALQDPSPQAEVLATSGITIGISGNEVAQVSVIRGTQSSLLAGTSRAVYQISAVNQDQTFGPTETVVARPTNAIGATLTGAWSVRDKVFFLLPSEERLFQMGFQLQSDSHVASEVSLYNPDIFAQGVLATGMQLDPEPIYWAVTRTNRLVGLTIENDQRVFGFHEHVLGGTDVVVESVAVIPDPQEGDDQVWLLVSRTIDGATSRFLEYMGPGYEDGDPISAQHFVDAGIEDTSGLATISGLSHLEGETVQVQADGGFLGTFTVAGGQIVLPEAHTVVHVGLPIVCEYNSVPIVVNDPQGSSFAKTQRLSQVSARTVRSVGGEVGGGKPGEIYYRQMDSRVGDSPIGTPLPLISDVYLVPVLGAPSNHFVYAARTAVPLNFELAAVGGFIDSSSR
jgi:hypothetical protein